MKTLLVATVGFILGLTIVMVIGCVYYYFSEDVEIPFRHAVRIAFNADFLFEFACLIGIGFMIAFGYSYNESKYD